MEEKVEEKWLNVLGLYQNFSLSRYLIFNIIDVLKSVVIIQYYLLQIWIGEICYKYILHILHLSTKMAR